jgi:hypothetical protein
MVAEAARMRILLVLGLIGCNGNGLGNKTFGVPLVHRATAGMCSSDRPAYNCGLMLGPMTCTADSDCTAGAEGRCVGNGHDGCSCSYDTCVTDADCAANQLCDCRSDWHYGANGPNRCLPSDCRTDADCGPGGYCSPSMDPGCGRYFGVTLWRCHTPGDTCVNDSDCAGTDGGWGTPFCGWRPEVGHWACAVTQCVG